MGQRLGINEPRRGCSFLGQHSRTEGWEPGFPSVELSLAVSGIELYC